MERLSACSFESNAHLEAVVMTDSVTDIMPSAFFCCCNLGVVKLSPHLREIDDTVFLNCRSLVDVSVPNTVERLGAYSFSGCESLESVRLPEGLAIIDEHAFSHSGRLSSVHFPSTVKDMGLNLFEDCASLSDVYCEMSDPGEVSVQPLSTDKGLFSRCVLHVPFGSIGLYRDHLVFGRFEKIVVI